MATRTLVYGAYWSNAANWEDSIKPSAGDNVLISYSGGTTHMNEAPPDLGSLFIDPANTLHIDGAYSIVIAGDINFYDGGSAIEVDAAASIDVAGDIKVTGASTTLCTIDGNSNGVTLNLAGSVIDKMNILAMDVVLDGTAAQSFLHNYGASEVTIDHLTITNASALITLVGLVNVNDDITLSAGVRLSLASGASRTYVVFDQIVINGTADKPVDIFGSSFDASNPATMLAGGSPAGSGQWLRTKNIDWTTGLSGVDKILDLSGNTASGAADFSTYVDLYQSVRPYYAPIAYFKSPAAVVVPLLVGGRAGVQGVVRTDGTAWLWGYGGSGRLGNFSDAHRSSPVSVVGNHSFIQVSTGTCAIGLKADGTCWCWGDSTAGETGDNTATSKSSPVSVVGNHSFIAVSAGAHMCMALKADGTCWCWGYGAYGTIGNGSTASRSSPVSVVGAHSFIKIAAPYQDYAAAMALKANGECWCWGFNGYGNCGDNATTNRTSPVRVTGNHSFITIATGGANQCALKADGTAWSWGYSNGDNATATRSSPVSVVGAHSFIAIACGWSTTSAMKADGSIWSWGLGGGLSGDLASGQIGDQTAGVGRSSPVSVVGNHSFIQLIRSYWEAGGLKSNGQVWMWGDNAFGQLGQQNTTNRSSPVLVVMTFT